MITNRFSRLQRGVTRKSLGLYCFTSEKTIPRINPLLTVAVKLCSNPVELENVQRSVVEQRISRGHKLFVAFYQSKPVAYLFVATAQCRVDEVEDMLYVRPNEVYLYDAFTNVKYRGNRIYPFLISDVVRFYKGKGYSYTLIFTTSSNHKSARGIKRAGFSCYQVVHFHNLFGFKIWNYSPRSQDVQSTFGNENAKAQFQFGDMENNFSKDTKRISVSQP
ncbi:MAG: hypothetical protein E3J78_05100 [Candidatus Cloacimonadota bacterium]|nr:MAG: hypothetical protein E3J78_05100 [Candidatus Cloacimonadota bacterium]